MNGIGHAKTLTERLQTSLMKLLEQVLDLLSNVCRQQRLVNDILEDYRDVQHLTEMVSRLVGVASNSFRQVEQDNKRLSLQLEQTVRQFSAQRIEHIKLEKELKGYIQTLERDRTEVAPSREQSKKKEWKFKGLQQPAVKTTASTNPSLSLEKVTVGLNSRGS